MVVYQVFGSLPTKFMDDGPKPKPGFNLGPNQDPN